MEVSEPLTSAEALARARRKREALSNPQPCQVQASMQKNRPACLRTRRRRQGWKKNWECKHTRTVLTANIVVSLIRLWEKEFNTHVPTLSNKSTYSADKFARKRKKSRALWWDAEVKNTNIQALASINHPVVEHNIAWPSVRRGKIIGFNYNFEQSKIGSCPKAYVSF